MTDSSLVPIDINWSYDIKFDYKTGEPSAQIGQFKFVGCYKLARIDEQKICRFMGGFNSAISTFTFVIGVEENDLISLLTNKSVKPSVAKLLSMAKYVVTLKIVEDDEGNYNHILIQSEDKIGDKIKKLEYILEIFIEKYSKLITKIGESKDIERNTKFYLDKVKKIRDNIFEIDYKERVEPLIFLKKKSLTEIKWSKLSTSKGLNSAIDVPIMLQSISIYSSELYNTITRQGAVYTASYYAIALLIDIIKNDNLSSSTEAYDFLYEIVIGYSAYDEKVLYKGKELTLKEANYKAVLDYIELYFTDLANEKSKKKAKLILDLLSLFLDKDDEYIKRLATISENSVISKEINEYLLDYSNMDKMNILDKVLCAKQDKDNFKISEDEYQKVLDDGLNYLSENTGCADDLRVTQNILDRLYTLKIIDSEMYRECIEKSACNRWL